MKNKLMLLTGSIFLVTPLMMFKTAQYFTNFILTRLISAHNAEKFLENLAKKKAYNSIGTFL